LFGSFTSGPTGGAGERDGLFRQAQGGALLLDELNQMPMGIQGKLLSILVEKEYRPVGGSTSYPADFRVIASINCPLEALLKQGKLRQELHARIAGTTISLLPLRQRREDIMPLAKVFLTRYAGQGGKFITGFTPGAANLLESLDWPENVRELQRAVERAVRDCEKSVVDVRDLSRLGGERDFPGRN
jgi:DNA-binding NtrC family response regulator